MKKNILAGGALLAALALVATGCAGSSGGSGDGGDGAGGDEPITVGFAQTGSESGWRSANTESMKTAFSAENGFDLTFNAADNDPAAQIAAVRSFINQGVDAIVIAPIVEDGWDDVLQEAADADIPVILEDRTVTSSDDLYASWVGLDFKKEGVMAGEWAAETFGDTPTNMVVLEGTTGSAPANDRAEGFAEAIEGTGDHDARLADGRLHAGRRQDRDGGLPPEVRRRDIDLRLRAQRRHGARRDRGDRGRRTASRAWTSRSCRSTRSRTACRRWSTGRSTSSSSATRCWASSQPGS